MRAWLRSRGPVAWCSLLLLTDLHHVDDVCGGFLFMNQSASRALIYKNTVQDVVIITATGSATSLALAKLIFETIKRYQVS